MDLDRKRPIEIRVLDRRDEGGISQNDASENKCVTADAFVLLRLLVDPSNINLGFSAIEGWDMQEMAFEGMFSMWLAFAGHLARKEVTDPTQEAQRAFVERLLNMLQLGPDLKSLQLAPGADASVSERVLPDGT
jgi:hypothetical protein